MTKFYSGRGSNQIVSFMGDKSQVKATLYTVTDEEVTTVEFVRESKGLVLRVHGQEYDNITNALIDLEPVLAQPTRGGDGSKEGTAGNAASNIIGQYSIFKHIRFGGRTGVTLADIVGTERGSNTSVTIRQVRTPVTGPKQYSPDSPIKFGPGLKRLFGQDRGTEYFTEQLGAEQLSKDFSELTIAQFAAKHGITSVNLTH
jgi:hypothetical protein